MLSSLNKADYYYCYYYYYYYYYYYTSTSTTKHVQQFGDEQLAMVDGGWDPEILITGHAGKYRHEETTKVDEQERIR